MVLKVQRYQINSVDYLLKTKQTVAITLCCMGISPELELSLLENTRAPETHEVRKTSKFSEPMLKNIPKTLPQGYQSCYHCLREETLRSVEHSLCMLHSELPECSFLESLCCGLLSETAAYRSFMIL